MQPEVEDELLIVLAELELAILLETLLRKAVDYLEHVGEIESRVGIDHLVLLLVQVKWRLLLEHEVKEVGNHLGIEHPFFLGVPSGHQVIPKLEVLLEPDPILGHLLHQEREYRLQA